MAETKNPEADTRNYDTAGNVDSKPLQSVQSEVPQENEETDNVPSTAERLSKLESANPENGKDGSKKAASKDELADEEEEPDRSGYSALDDIREQLGKGYTGKGSQKNKMLAKMFSGNSVVRKRLAIAAAVGGAGIGATLLSFVLLLPLKLDHITELINGHYSAALKSAMDKETESMIAQYYAKRVLPAFLSPSCRGKTTVDASCVRPPDDGIDNPVSKVFRAWQDQKVERKLAERGLVVGAHKDGRLFIRYLDVTQDLSNTQIRDITSLRTSMFDSFGSKQVDRTEFRKAIRESVKGMTLRDRMYMRFKLGPMLERKYGVRRCVFICKVTDPIRDRYEIEKSYFKGAFARRIITPFNEEVGLALECLSAGMCGSTVEGVDYVDERSGMRTKVSEYRNDLTNRLNTYAIKYKIDGAEDLAKLADDIEKDGGPSKRLLIHVLQKVMNKQAARQVAGLATGPLKLVLFLGDIQLLMKNADVAIAGISYALATSNAVQQFAMLNTMQSELHNSAKNFSGDRLGSAVDAFSSNGIDMSVSPAYAYIAEFGSSSSVPSAQGLFPKVYAAAQAGEYTCEDGNAPPAGGLCSEMMPTYNPTAAKLLAMAVETNPIASRLLDVYAKIMNIAGDLLAALFGPLLNLLPLDDVVEWVKDKASPLVDLLMQMIRALLPNNLIDGSNNEASGNPSALPSGARVFELSALGANVSFNESTQEQYGGMRVSQTRAAKIKADYLNEQRKEFQSQNIAKRLFDTKSQYSFVSRVALATPTSMQVSSQRTIGALLENPFSKMFSSFSVLGASYQADAALSTDIFGVAQNAIPEEELDKMGDREALWDRTCSGDKLEAYNKQWIEDMKVDEKTGTFYAERINVCQWLQANATVHGGRYDNSLIPSQEATVHQSQASAIGTVATGSAADLAKKILASPNITFQTPQKRAYFEKAAQTGTQSSCGTAVTLDPRLLGIILTLSEKYKIVLGVFIDGHSCNDGFHPQGKAVDINGVNPLSGTSGGTGNRIGDPVSEFKLPLVQSFIKDGIQLLSSSGGGSLGQQQCLGFPATNPAPNVSWAQRDANNCTHIHFSTGIR